VDSVVLEVPSLGAEAETAGPNVVVIPPRHNVAVDNDAGLLERDVSFRFALDLSGDQEQLAWQLVGSRRFVYNRLLDGVCDRMTARVWEAELGTLPWTPWGSGKLDLIRQVKALRAAHPWLAAQPWDIAECAAVDPARNQLQAA